MQITKFNNFTLNLVDYFHFEVRGMGINVELLCF